MLRVSFSGPADDSFGRLVKQSLSVLVVDVLWDLTGVLIRAGAPSVLAGVHLDEETLRGVFVPMIQGFIQKHDLEPVKGRVIADSLWPWLRKDNAIPCKRMARCRTHMA